MHRFRHAADESRIFKYAFTAEFAVVVICTFLPATLLGVSPRVIAGVGLSVVAPAFYAPRD
jgi:hypothetical protein